MIEDRGLVDKKLTLLWLRTGWAHRHAAAGSFEKPAERDRDADMVPVFSDFDSGGEGNGEPRSKSINRCSDADPTSEAV